MARKSVDCQPEWRGALSDWRQAASAEEFAGLPSQQFKSNMASCWSPLLRIMSTESASTEYINNGEIESEEADSNDISATTYDTGRLQESVLTINWDALCNQHNRTITGKKNTSAGGSHASTKVNVSKLTTILPTALQAVLDFVASPCHIPQACDVTTIRALMQVWMTRHQSREQSSIERGGESNMSITGSYSAHKNLCKQVIMSTIETLLFRNKSTMHEIGYVLWQETTFTQHLGNVYGVMAIVKHLWKTARCSGGGCNERVSMMQDTDLVPAIFGVMAACDRYQFSDDLSLMQNEAMSGDKGGMPRSLRSGIDQVGLLHGDVSVDEFEASMGTSRRKIGNTRGSKARQQGDQGMDGYSTSALDACTYNNQLSYKQHRSIDRLRDKCFQMLHTYEKSKTEQSQSIAWFHTVWQYAMHEMSPPSVRLYLTLYACQSKLLGVEFLLQHLCSCALDELGECYAFCFALETIADLSYFDHQYRLWKAARPFLVHLLAKASMEESTSTDSITANTRCYLNSLAYLLTRRGKMLTQHAEFASLVAQISAVYDKESYWISSWLPEDEQHRIMDALTSAGILSFCARLPSRDLKPRSGKSKKSVEQSVSHLQLFPQSSNSIRVCMSRVASEVGRFDLFSHYSYNNSLPPIEQTRAKSHQSAKNGHGDDDIVSCMNDDIIYTIFSYLGSKKLLSMRRVCKQWQRVADSHSLWFPLYAQHWGIREDDPRAGDIARQPWREHYKNKTRAKRYLDFRKAYRPWLCNYIGCNMVVKSKKQWVEHMAHHKEMNESCIAKYIESDIEPTVRVKRQRKRPASTRGGSGGSRRAKKAKLEDSAPRYDERDDELLTMIDI
jgi:F-box-like